MICNRWKGKTQKGKKIHVRHTTGMYCQKKTEGGILI